MNMKLTRKASVLLFCSVIVFVVLISYLLIPKVTPEKKTAEYQYEMLLENMDIKASGEIITGSNASAKYIAYKITVSQGELMGGYKLSKTQTFVKTVQLTAPKNNEMIDNKQATHMAYSFLLTGDIIQVTNKDTKEKEIIIENGSVSFARIPFILSDKQDQAFIKGAKSSKTKKVSYARLKLAIKDPLLRKTMIDI